MNISGLRNSLAIIVGLGVAACVSPPAPSSAGNPQASSGRLLLEKHCAACHAVGRSDRSKHRDAPAFRTLSRSYPVAGLEESLAEGMMVGHPDMPEIEFQAEDVAAIISYLESIQEP